MLIDSQQALLKSFRQAGFPISEATRNFERLLNGYADMYKKALDNMEDMARVYGDLLKQFRAMSP